MHKENILKLADFIEKLPHKHYDEIEPGEEAFDLGAWFDRRWSYDPQECGSVGCIGGWANELAKRGMMEGTFTLNEESRSLFSAEILGLTAKETSYLLFPGDPVYDNATPADAARTLRYFAETREVDWSHVEGWKPNDDEEED